MDTDNADKASKHSSNANDTNNEEEKKENVVEGTEQVEKKEGEALSGHGVVINEDVPKDKVNLRLLRPNGTRTDVIASASDTILTVKQQIFDSWPQEWTDEVPTSIENIKILHYGKYLEDDTTLEANKIPEGQTTIVHLIIKFTKKELDQKDKEEEKTSGSSSSCCCIIS